jgi:hypothetical protein
MRMSLEGGFGADPTSDAYKRSDTGAQIGIGIATMGRTGVGWVARLGSKGLSALGAKGGAVVAEKVGAAAAEEAGAGSRALEKCAANSFAASTLVLMGDGSRKPIEDVEVGDTVLATDPETREAGPRTVLALHVNQDTDLTDLTVRDKNGDTTVVHTTDEHPFWNNTDQTWTDADTLEPGDELRSTTGPGPTVAQVITFTGATTMYNLTVADIHTYYVLAGNTPVLVHNDGGIYSWPNTDGPIPQRGQTALYAQFDQRTGEFLKWGVWSNTTGNYSRYTQSYLRTKGIQTTVIRNFDSKAEAHAVERDLAARAPGPHNVEQYAGSKSTGENPLDIIRGLRGGLPC